VDLQALGVGVTATVVSAPGATTTAPAIGLEAVLEKTRAKAVFDLDAPAAAPKPAVTAEIKADDAVVKRVTTLEQQARADKAKIAELEATAKQSEALAKVKALWKEGKRRDAIGLLAEADPTQEMEALLTEHLEHQTDETESALATRVAEVDKRLGEAEARQKDQEAKDAARAAQEAEASTLAFATHALDAAVNDDGTPKFELCARPVNRDGAAKLAISHAVDLAIKRGLDPENLTPDAARALLQDAYADVETELEAEGVVEQKRIEERFRRTPKATPTVPAARQAQPSPVSISPPNSGGDQGQQTREQTSRPQPLPKPGAKTEKPTPTHSLEAVLAKNRERARY
jgi:hypothetical protein